MTDPFPTEDHDLDAAISSAYTNLSRCEPMDDDYAKIVDQISNLYKLRNDQNKLTLELHQSDAKHKLEHAQWEYECEQNERPFFQRVDPNTALTVFGNIFIGLAVIKYEQTGVISSKVMSFMRKI